MIMKRSRMKRKTEGYVIIKCAKGRMLALTPSEFMKAQKRMKSEVFRMV